MTRADRLGTLHNFYSIDKLNRNTNASASLTFASKFSLNFRILCRYHQAICKFNNTYSGMNLSYPQLYHHRGRG